MKKNLLKNSLFSALRRPAPEPKESDIQRRLTESIVRVTESFTRIANSSVFHWESQQHRDLAFIGGILAHGPQSVTIALAVLPTLETLAGISPEEAMRQGKLEWQDAMKRLSSEVLKLGTAPQENTFFSLKGTQNAHRN